MNTTRNVISKTMTKIFESTSLNEDDINETLRLKMLEDRRVQQVNTLRRNARFNYYARG